VKCCAGCKKELQLRKFGHNSRTRDGKAVRCFTCTADAVRFRHNYYRRLRAKLPKVKVPLSEAVLAELRKQSVMDFDSLYERLRGGRVMGFKDQLSDTVARLWDDGKIKIIRYGEFRGYALRTRF
jgi:hypothetical protein